MLNCFQFDLVCDYTLLGSLEQSFVIMGQGFDLVCDLTLLGGLAQSFVIMGQGVGAVIASIVSDRFGRKKVLVGSQFGLMAVGMAIGLSPSYAVLGTLKFLVGAIQQGVVTSSATLTTELFPVETRRLTSPVGSITWGVSSTGMALVAYLLRFHTWRYLQYTLSACSILFLFQLWYVDESLRWLVANGKKEGAIKVLERAVRANKKDLNDVLRTFETTALRDVQKEEEMQAVDKDKSSSSNGQMTSPDIDEVEKKLAKKLEKSKTEKLSVFDIFRHKRLLLNAIIIWCAWFTCAFTFFALMMMSTTFVGNRFLNYSLISIMDLPSGLIFFLLVNRVGRKRMTQILYTFAGVGLLSSGIFRIFEDIPALATMSVVMAMLGNTGASGMFGAIFFYTPEIFPTNMRNQALGVASFAGRLGGMLAPFMTALSEIVVWAPGVMIGSLCFTVVFLFRFLPETQGKELPNTVGDIKAWYKPINDEKIIRSSNGDGKPVKTAAERAEAKPGVIADLDVDWNSSRVEYGQCHIAVNRSDDRVQYYDCMFGYVDESLRWLVANGKKEGAIKVLKRAARVNKKDLNEVLETVQMSVTQNGAELEAFVPPTSADEMDPKLTTGHSPNGIGSVEKTLERQAEKLTLLDIFRHKRLLFNTLIVWVAWFTCAFSFFALIMMSSSLVGDRFLNYALIVIMESPPGLIFYFSVNRFGRKRTTQVFYMLTGVGLLASGIFRIFEDIPALAMMSVVMAMLGMVGASGMFGAIFFYTPELFPTNMRNQALGVASFAGRLGGMLSPFMNDLAEIVVWAPGVMIGTLSFLVVFLFQFLPETKGTELPQTVADIKAWYKPKDVEILYEPPVEDEEPTKKQESCCKPVKSQ
nr:hypothetical protein BaRGS_025944 [Batillaria attramentaria]